MRESFRHAEDVAKQYAPDEDCGVKYDIEDGCMVFDSWEDMGKYYGGLYTIEEVFKMKTNRLGCIEIDPKIIEVKLRAEFGPSHLEDTIPSEKISHINIKEGADSVFPQDKFDVYVRSGDICNPRFHVASDGWDVAFFISNGKVHNICKRGADMGVLNKMRVDAIKWLSCQNAYEPDKTNRQVIEIMWARMHV